MDYEKLILELEGYTYWLGQSGPESHDVHPAVCDKAAEAIKTLVAERDTLLRNLHGVCSACKHYSPFWTEVCRGCKHGHMQAGPLPDNWEWRGV